MQQDNLPTTWSHPPDDLRLKHHQVDIWRAFLDLSTAPIRSFESSLSADETERAARYHFSRDRDRFILAHECLRDILARYLQREPEQLCFSKGKFGKPVLLTGTGIEFNLSHSGDYVLIVVTCELTAGIDVERVREDIEIEKIAGRYFSQREVSELMELHPEQRLRAFFYGWTRKEAYIKAHGLGLSLPLDSFDVSLAPTEEAIIRATRPDPDEASCWTLLPLDVDIAYAGAVAVKGQGLEFRYWDWNLTPLR